MLDVDATTLSLIELFYRAAIEPEAWQVALERVTDLFGSDHALLFTNMTSRVMLPFAATTGLDSEERARFFTPRAIEQWDPWQSAFPRGRFTSMTEYVSERTLESTDIYNEVIRPTNGFYAAFVQQNRPDLNFHFALCRERQAGTYTREETQRLQILLPHVTTALELHQRLRAAEDTAGDLTALLDRLDEGAILTDAQGHGLHRNARAARILEEADGLAAAGAGLRSGSVALTRQLHEAIASVGASAAGETRRLSVPRPSGRLPLLLNIMPVWRLGVGAHGMCSPRVAIFIREPDAPLNIDKSALIDTFGFTPRESDVACLLARGLSLEAIAASLGLRIATVRYNLKHAFEKACVHNQAGLVALVRCFGRGAG